MKRSWQSLWITPLVVALSALLTASLIVGLGLPALAPHALAQSYPGTIPSALPNYPLAALPFTATSQTVARSIGGFSYCTFSVTGVALTTATIQLKGSNDGGTTYYALGMAPLATGTSSQSAVAVTTSTAFYANVAGWTNLEFVTSGTFTATSIAIKPVCTSNKGLL